MAYFTDINGREHLVAGHYVFKATSSYLAGGCVRAWTADSLVGLADVIYRHSYEAGLSIPSWRIPPGYLRPRLEARMPDGRTLCVEELYCWGRRRVNEATAAGLFPGYQRRQGPVPGVGGYRRYGRIRFRRPRTKQALTQALSTLRQEGEPAVRPSRNEHYLPSFWDDDFRERERSWKAQHRGRKAWDRPKLR